MASINFDYYTADNNYNDIIYGQYNDDILNYIRTIDKKDYKEILEKDKRTIIYDVFCNARNNIIKWYDFNKNSKILEIGANYGEITEELANHCSNITSIEFSKEKAESIQKRHGDLDNLEIICGNLKDIKFKEKYDYVVAIGVLEFYKQLGFSSCQEFLRFLKDILTENGKIILATDNKFGLKYLVGAKKYDSDYFFSNFSFKKEMELFGKNELYNICKELEFKNIKFMYPFPDYKLTSVIYSDEYKPNFNEHKLRYNLIYGETDEILSIEYDVLREVIKNNQFDFFANSFFIELSNNDLSNVKFVNYSNLRKSNCRTMLIHKDNVFIKSMYDYESKNHIEKIKRNLDILNNYGIRTLEYKEEDYVISKFFSAETYDKFLNRLVEKENFDEFFSSISEYFNYINCNFKSSTNCDENVFKKYDIKVDIEKLEKMHFIKDGFWDFIFQNVFFENKEYIIFDQEWYEENIPIEFIKYRSLKYLYELNSRLNIVIPYEKMLQKYELLEFVDVFEELERKLLENISEEYLIDFYRKKCERITSIENIKESYKKELSELYGKYDKLLVEKENLEKELSILNDKYNKLEKNFDEIKKHSVYYRINKDKFL